MRPLTPGVSHLYVVSVQEHTVLYEAVGFVPAALQLVQVEEVERTVIEPDSNTPLSVSVPPNEFSVER